MSTALQEITKPNDVLVPAGPVIALWDDVVKVMYDRPYSLCRIAQIDPEGIRRAKKQGYFSEAYARRINAATNGRLELIPNGNTKSGQRFQYRQDRAIRSRSV